MANYPVPLNLRRRTVLTCLVAACLAIVPALLSACGQITTAQRPVTITVRLAGAQLSAASEHEAGMRVEVRFFHADGAGNPDGDAIFFGGDHRPTLDGGTDTRIFTPEDPSGHVLLPDGGYYVLACAFTEGDFHDVTHWADDAFLVGPRQANEAQLLLEPTAGGPHACEQEPAR